MTASLKARWANILTTVASVVAIFQTLLTSPPFTIETIALLSGICTYVTLGSTTWKQYLSPDVSSTGTKVTIGIAIAATVAGLLNLVDVFNVGGDTAKWVKWAITVAVAILNILSKQIFPSELQKDRMKDLKSQ